MEESLKKFSEESSKEWFDTILRKISEEIPRGIDIGILGEILWGASWEISKKNSYRVYGKEPKQF